MLGKRRGRIRVRTCTSFEERMGHAVRIVGAPNGVFSARVHVLRGVAEPRALQHAHPALTWGANRLFLEQVLHLLLPLHPCLLQLVLLIHLGLVPRTLHAGCLAIRVERFIALPLPTVLSVHELHVGSPIGAHTRIRLPPCWKLILWQRLNVVWPIDSQRLPPCPAQSEIAASAVHEGLVRGGPLRKHTSSCPLCLSMLLAHHHHPLCTEVKVVTIRARFTLTVEQLGAFLKASTLLREHGVLVSLELVFRHFHWFHLKCIFKHLRGFPVASIELQDDVTTLGRLPELFHPILLCRPRWMLQLLVVVAILQGAHDAAHHACGLVDIGVVAGMLGRLQGLPVDGIQLVIFNVDGVVELRLELCPELAHLDVLHLLPVRGAEARTLR
mmetsp:Transcript_9286/g.26071  ORF Transcript_9286/g.26071 Transcript_9286/m.26071 type:complete len:385 (-) Transcript_9286:133-1287(-)